MYECYIVNRILDYLWLCFGYPYVLRRHWYCLLLAPITVERCLTCSDTCLFPVTPLYIIIISTHAVTMNQMTVNY